MDSPALQSASTLSSRVQTHFTSTPTSSIDNRGAIHKRASNDRSRTISISQADRLYQIASEQASHADSLDHCPTSAAGIQWITPEHSPQLNAFAPSEATIEAFPQWTVPTPPRSDSGLPNVSIEDEPVLSSAPDFADFEQPASSEMSSLGFLLPSQYGASPYDSEPSNYTMDQSYMPPMRVSQPPTTTSGASTYTSTATSDPSLYQSRGPEARKPSELPTTTGSSYEPSYRRISSPYDSTTSSGYSSMPPRDSILSISGLTHSPLPSPHMSTTSAGHHSPHYATSVPRSPNPYESNPYGQTYTSSAPPPSQLYASSHQYPPPSSFVGSNATSEPSGKSHSSDSSSIRVLNQRPKPQCWEHGCNGRQFSTFSNLLRHQREKSGSASKSYCPKCGAEFTRTTARNGHLAHDKCTKQQRRTSDGGK